MDDLVYRLRKRAEIRRQIPDRKSVQEGQPDRIADLLEEAANALSKRKWVGLTDEAIWLEYQQLWPFHPEAEPTLAKDIAKFAKAIESKLKEMNK